MEHLHEIKPLNMFGANCFVVYNILNLVRDNK